MTAPQPYAKPLPRLTDLNRPFWEGTLRNELRMQRCAACGHLRYPISVVCPRCLSGDGTWETLSGRGEVLSFVEFHRAYNKAFTDDVPYNVALVELDEGPRMFGNVVGAAIDDIFVGMKVEALFERVTGEVAIPRFRPMAQKESRA